MQGCFCSFEASGRIQTRCELERDLEGGLVAHVQQFLLELGVGFAFVGRQVPLTVGDKDFRLDLLFTTCASAVSSSST